MKKSNKNKKWLGWGVLAVLVIVMIVLLSFNGSNEPTSNTAIGGEASLTLLSPSTGTIEVGDLQHVRWTSENYAPGTVSVNVLRKVSDNPNTYEFVRTIALSTSNDGDAVWVPSKKDIGDNIFIQVGCILSDQACSATRPTVALAVINSDRFSNAANAFQAIEAASN